MLALGDVRRLDEGELLLRISQVVHAPERGAEPIGGNAELFRCGLEQQRAQLHRRVLDGVAGHHRDAARVRAEVDRCERCVSGHDVHVLGEDAERLGGDRREHVVRALPDLRGAAHHGHAAAAVDADLRARVRHRIPVDRQTRARDVRAAGDADALALRQALALRVPAGRLSHRLQAIAEAHGRDAQVVHGAAVRRLQHPQPVLDRVEAELRRDLVELALERVPRLCGAVTALRAARRLVRVHAHAVELVGGDPVGHRHERAGVVGGRDAVRGVGAAVEVALEMHRGDLAVLLHPGAQVHLHRMAAAMRVKDLLAVERELHRPFRAHGEQGC